MKIAEFFYELLWQLFHLSVCLQSIEGEEGGNQKMGEVQLSTNRSKNYGLCGFTLIELLIVVAIIGIIAAIAIPSLLRSRLTANEIAAVGGLKVITGGQTDYHTNTTSPRTFSTNLENLGNGNGAGGVGFIPPDLALGLKSGYTFYLQPGPLLPLGFITTWSATCWPLNYRGTGVRSFYIDQSGVIRGSDNNGNMGSINLPSIE